MLVLGQTKPNVRVELNAAGAFIILAPISPAMRRRASYASRRMLGKIEDINDIDVDLMGDVAELGSRELMRMGALEWGGLGDEAGKELPLTPDRETRFATANQADRPTGTIDQLLDDEDLFATIEEQYIRPDALRRAEKNGLSASPNGTGGAATRAKTTAASAAKAKVRTSAAKPARTASTHSKAKPAKASGTR